MDMPQVLDDSGGQHANNSNTPGGNLPALAAAPLSAPLQPTLPTTAARPRYHEMERLQSLWAVKADNVWDLFFPELQAKILEHAGPLTRFLCGRLKAAKMDDADKRALWVDVIKQDWPGDLALLPSVKLTPKDIAHVKTRRMYERLRGRFPDASKQPWIPYIPLQNMWLDSLPSKPNAELGWMAIEANCVDFVKHLLDTGLVTIGKLDRPYSRAPSVDAAATSGHLEMVQYLSSRGDAVFAVSTMDAAAFSGNLDLVKWLHFNRTEGCTEGAMNTAAMYGHIHVVKWLHSNRTEGCTTIAMDYAAFSGNLDLVKWLHSNRAEGCTTDAMGNAAKGGHLHVVKWLHANRTEGCTTKAMDWAASNGHLHIVQWLHANRTEGCTEGAMNFAADNGHLHIIQWLHANRTEGCTTDAMDLAAESWHFDVFLWLHANRTEGCTTEAINAAAGCGRLDIIQLILETTAVECTSDAITMAARRGHLHVIQWILENTAVQCATDTIDKTAEYGKLEVMQWLLEHRMADFSHRAIIKAKNDKVALYLLGSLTPERRRAMQHAIIGNYGSYAKPRIALFRQFDRA